MARKAMIEKAKMAPKFSSRAYHRCKECGRARGYLRKFQLCRLCFRMNANRGHIPGVTKASW